LTDNDAVGTSEACSPVARLTQISTAGGSTVSEVIEVAAIPTGPSSPLATTIETEAASRRIAALNAAGRSSATGG
jgi:hypothetical protein